MRGSERGIPKIRDAAGLKCVTVPSWSTVITPAEIDSFEIASEEPVIHKLTSVIL